jgi:hypothetical protein
VRVGLGGKPLSFGTNVTCTGGNPHRASTVARTSLLAVIRSGLVADGERGALVAVIRGDEVARG